MTVPYVSIIVPVFNGERFINGIAGFIHAQTFGDYEVIFAVDRSSSDGSVNAAQEAAGTFRSGRVCIQDDGLHLGGARNVGLRAAQGDFVWFCDVDDAPSPEILEEFHRIQSGDDADIVCCNFQNIGPGDTLKEHDGAEYTVTCLDRCGALRLRSENGIPVTAWSKLFRRSMLTDNDIFFRDSMAEDIEYTYRTLNCASRICVYDRPLYGYRMTDSSICRTKANMDDRGKDEIAAYDRADTLCDGLEDVLRSNARMKIRSSSHMRYMSYMEYAMSDACRRSYSKHLKGTFEGSWHHYLPTTYFIAIRFYVRFIYKRVGSTDMDRMFDLGTPRKR